MAEDITFKDMKDVVSSALIATTRVVAQISSEDLAFHRSSNPSVVLPLEQQCSRLLNLVEKLAKVASPDVEFGRSCFSDIESVEENWKAIVDVADNLLEKADGCLDEYTGFIRQGSTTQEEQDAHPRPFVGKSRLSKAYRKQIIPKPQLLFEKAPTNHEREPFKPLICSKPHAIVSLSESIILTTSKDGLKQYTHPYEAEIQSSQYPVAIYTRNEPIPYLPYATTEAIYVDTVEAVRSMLEDLKSASEIAVDLEHHDEHTYHGLVSLMQISTREKDWIIDTLKPWRQELEMLNEVFTDPTILKVFHGAYMDVTWLQRDFGLYVVGLFDTYHASRFLAYPKHSLAYLLRRFANFDAAKQYQMADWRIRPLPQQMFDYARSDTHFLLNVFDNLRNELLDHSSFATMNDNLINAVQTKSKEAALQRYERPLYDLEHGLGPLGWYKMLSRTPALFSRKQLAVFRAVHQWRDMIARQEDESVNVIMRKHILYNIARDMPVSMPSLLGCSHPLSEAVRKRKEDLLKVIVQAKVDGAVGPEMKEVMQMIQPDHSTHTLGASENFRPSVLPLTLRQEQIPLERNQLGISLRRAQKSRFWGSTIPGGFDAKQSIVDLPEQSFRLALPLPSLTVEVTESSSPWRTAESCGIFPNHRAAYGHIQYQGPKEDENSVLKEAGDQIKSKPSTMQIPFSPLSQKSIELAQDYADDVSKSESILTVAENARTADEALITNEQKHAKRMEEARSPTYYASDVNANQRPADEQMFDYANVPSVLQGKKSGQCTAENSRFAKPYVKSTRGPKRPLKTKEISGKSITFRC